MNPPLRVEWDARRERISLPSDPRCLREVRRIVEEQARALGYREDEIHDVTVAVHEAVMNAIVHGNQGTPHSAVEIRLDHAERHWVVRVRNQGAGFDIRQAVQAMRGEIPPRPESGRGLRIIAQLVDQVTFADGGREIALWKRLPPDTRR